MCCAKDKWRIFVEAFHRTIGVHCVLTQQTAAAESPLQKRTSRLNHKLSRLSADWVPRRTRRPAEVLRAAKLHPPGWVSYQQIHPPGQLLQGVKSPERADFMSPVRVNFQLRNIPGRVRFGRREESREGWFYVTRPGEFVVSKYTRPGRAILTASLQFLGRLAGNKKSRRRERKEKDESEWEKGWEFRVDWYVFWLVKLQKEEFSKVKIIIFKFHGFKDFHLHYLCS